MERMKKTLARVVPEPSNPWDKDAHKVVIRHDGLDYKMGCLRKGHVKEFPPGEYACFFEESLDRYNKYRMQCFLQKKVEKSAADRP